MGSISLRNPGGTLFIVEMTVFSDVEELADHAARAVAAVAAEALTGRRVSIGLAGGSTPAATYQRLAHDRSGWEGVELWLSDERWVPPQHADSNGRMVEEILGPTARLHRPRYSEFLTAADSAAHYEAALRRLHAATPPDLILLGMGTDGHTASLFPDTHALDVSGRHYVANWVEALGVWRLTATFDLIASARQVLVLVAGAAKAEPLARAIEDPECRFPIRSVFERSDNLQLLVDREAASELADR
jgi:6-phosphogluconolactonase